MSNEGAGGTSFGHAVAPTLESKLERRHLFSVGSLETQKNTAAVEGRSRHASARKRGVLDVLAVFLCGVFAFLDLYCTQPMLPMLAGVFHVTEAQVGITISAMTVGVAISAVLLALFGERFPRKTVIVTAMTLLAASTLLTSTAHSLMSLAAWRFMQGLAMPGVFIIAVTYVLEEWPALELPRVMSIYVSGTVFGGFLGRLVGGYVAARWSWNAVFFVLGTMGLLGVAVVGKMLGHSRHQPHVPAEHSRLAPIAANLRNSRLLATFLIGFCMLFTLVATFNFITFYLSAKPFLLTTSQLSTLFSVYLIGILVTVIVGSILVRIGLRNGMLLAVVLGVAGVGLTLVPSLISVGIGLAAASSCVFIAQTCANSFLRDAAPAGGRVSAAGMYIFCYYVGGTVGGMLPGLVWRSSGWPGCVALIAAALLVAGATTWIGWRHRRQPDPVPV